MDHRSKAPLVFDRKNLVVLDVNGVLCYKVYKSKDLVKNKDNMLVLTHCNVYFHPEAKDFFKWLFGRYRVAIYSSTTSKNVKPILKHLLTKQQYEKLEFIWCRYMCTLDPEYGIRKEIKMFDTIKLVSSVLDNPVVNANRRYNISNILLLDDSYLKLRFNPQKCYHIIPTFHPDNNCNVNSFEFVKAVIDFNFTFNLQ